MFLYDFTRYLLDLPYKYSNVLCILCILYYNFSNYSFRNNISVFRHRYFALLTACLRRRSYERRFFAAKKHGRVSPTVFLKYSQPVPAGRGLSIIRVFKRMIMHVSAVIVILFGFKVKFVSRCRRFNLEVIDCKRCASVDQQ